MVAVFDLVGIKELAPDGDASKQMRQLHDLVMHATTGNRFDYIARAYTWNDSVLLLAYVDDHQHGYASAMRDFYNLKDCIDDVSESYGVVVKGRSFPSPKRAVYVAAWPIRVHRSIKLCHGELHGHLDTLRERSPLLVSRRARLA